MRKRVLVAAGAVAVLLLPVALGDYRTYLLNLGLVYAAAALSLVVLTGWSGLPSLGHAAFFGIGAFSAALVARWEAPFALAFLLALAVAIPLGLLVGLPALRLGGLLLALATLGLSVAVQRLLFEWNWVTGGKAGLRVAAPNVFGVLLDRDQRLFYLIAPVVGVFFLGVANLRKSRIGRGLAALRASESAAACAGIPIVRYKLLAFVLSGSIAALAGTLYAYIFGSIGSGSFDAFLSFNLLAIAMIGGITSIAGAGVAGLVNSLGPQLTSVGRLTIDFYLVSSIGLILVMVRLPEGLVSLPRVARARLRRWASEETANAPRVPSTMRISVPWARSLR